MKISEATFGPLHIFRKWMTRIALNIITAMILNLMVIRGDVFAQWIQSKNSGYSGAVISLASNKNQLFVGTPHGVYRTAINSGIWSQYNSGLSLAFMEQQIN